MKYKYTSPEGPGYFILEYNDNGKLLKSYSNMGFEIKTHRSGAVWVGYCKELDVSSVGNSSFAASKSTKEAIDLWIASCVGRKVLKEALLELDFVEEPIQEA